MKAVSMVLAGVRTQFELLARNGQSPPLSPQEVHETLQVFKLTGVARCNASHWGEGLRVHFFCFVFAIYWKGLTY